MLNALVAIEYYPKLVALLEGVPSATLKECNAVAQLPVNLGKSGYPPSDVTATKPLTPAGVLAFFCLEFNHEETDIGKSYSYFWSYSGYVTTTQVTQKKTIFGNKENHVTITDASVVSFLERCDRWFKTANALGWGNDGAVDFLNGFGAGSDTSWGFFVLYVAPKLIDSGYDDQVISAAKFVWDSRLKDLERLAGNVPGYLADGAGAGAGAGESSSTAMKVAKGVGTVSVLGLIGYGIWKLWPKIFGA